MLWTVVPCLFMCLVTVRVCFVLCTCQNSHLPCSLWTSLIPGKTFPLLSSPARDWGAFGAFLGGEETSDSGCDSPSRKVCRVYFRRSRSPAPSAARRWHCSSPALAAPWVLALVSAAPGLPEPASSPSAPRQARRSPAPRELSGQREPSAHSLLLKRHAPETGPSAE